MLRKELPEKTREDYGIELVQKKIERGLWEVWERKDYWEDFGINQVIINIEAKLTWISFP